MTNKYLQKIAEIGDNLSSQPSLKKKSKPFKTALTESAIGLPLDLAAAGVGGKLGSKFGARGAAIGATAGTVLAGLGANYGVLKHQQLKEH